jgi:deoxyadenosine/deoxycytidine kinase
MGDDFMVGVVGPCGAGKSSLVAGLRARGIHARHIAQEHSYVQDMWKRITNPDILVYLDVSYENTILRRKLDWTYDEYLEQLRRLQHARQHADLVIDTNPVNIAQVLMVVLAFIDRRSPPQLEN